MLPQYIVLHHSAVAHSGKPQVTGINNGHKKRGFPKSSTGYHVGYHVFIEESGLIVHTRPTTEVGAHCQAQGMNMKSVGICMAGDFTKHTPSKLQLESLYVVLSHVMSRHNIPWSSVGPHSRWGQTACYGHLPKDPLELLKDQIKQDPVMVSEWAEEAVAKSQTAGIKDWTNPKEEVGNMTMAWMLRKAGILTSVWDGEKYVSIETGHGYVTKEQIAVALNRMGFFDLDIDEWEDEIA